MVWLESEGWDYWDSFGRLFVGGFVLRSRQFGKAILVWLGKWMFSWFWVK